MSAAPTRKAAARQVEKPSAPPSDVSDPNEQLAALLGFCPVRLKMLADMIRARRDQFFNHAADSPIGLTRMLLQRVAHSVNLAPLEAPLRLRVPTPSTATPIKFDGTQEQLEQQKRNRDAVVVIQPQPPQPPYVPTPEQHQIERGRIAAFKEQQDYAAPLLPDPTYGETLPAHQIDLELQARSRANQPPPQPWAAAPQPQTSAEQLEAARRRAAGAKPT